MPWLAREPSCASSITSDISKYSVEQGQYRNRYKQEKQERKMTLNAYSDLQQEFTHQAKELAEAKQTIDQLRLGATVDLYGKAPKSGTILVGNLPQQFTQSQPATKQVAQKIPMIPKPHLPSDTTDMSGIDLNDMNESDYDEVPASRNYSQISKSPHLISAATPKTANSTPHFARDNERTVLESGYPLIESTDLDLTDYTGYGEKETAESEDESKSDLYRTDLADRIDNIDDSIRNYQELVRMDQINLEERDNALKNLEQNTRKIEGDYINYKSEIGDKKLDPKNELSEEIVRLGRELAQLKRELEKAEHDIMQKPSSYGESVGTNKTVSSAETQIDRKR